MARGSMAKAVVEDKIRNTFGKDFIGVDPSTKKIYVQAQEDGEMVQICISMTCPKTNFNPSGDGDGFPTGDFREPDVYKPAEMTEGELSNVRKLIAELGL